jgi:hypothetical protein
MSYTDPFQIDGTPQEVAYLQVKQHLELVRSLVHAANATEKLVRNSFLQDLLEISEDHPLAGEWEKSEGFTITDRICRITPLLLTLLQSLDKLQSASIAESGDG